MRVPDYIRPHLPQTGVGSDLCLNLGMLLRESLAFPNSKDDPGLQLVDIVASAFTKAMNGKLPPPVWRLLGPLMVERPDSTLTAQLVALGTGPRITVGRYHSYVLAALRNRAKKLFVATQSLSNGATGESRRLSLRAHSLRRWAHAATVNRPGFSGGRVM